MKAFNYCRKSTKDKEDQQVLSLQGQREENEKVAGRGGFEIITTFQEEASAKEPGRKKFKDMLDRIEKGEADVLVCWRLNRLARNPVDGGRVQWLLQKGTIKAIVTSEKTYLPSDNVIQMSVELGMATQYSIDLGKDVMRGMRQKVQAGWKPHAAPIGYLNDYGGIKGQKVIHTDPERFPLVRRCWDYLLSGAHTVQEIHKLAAEWGLTLQFGRTGKTRPFALTSMYRMFNDPFYYGEFRWCGKLWPGLHEPMVTREEFDHVQEILGSRGRPRSQCHKNPFPGLIQCAHCSGKIVMEVKRKYCKKENREKTYQYFRCSKRKKDSHCIDTTRIDLDELEKQLYPRVMRAQLPRSFIEWALDELRLSQDDRRRAHEDGLRHLQIEQVKAEGRIDDLVDLRLEKASIPEEAFKRKMQSLEEEQHRIERLIADHKQHVKTWRDDVVDALLKIKNLREKFASLNPEGRLRLLRDIGQRIELNDGVLSFFFTEPFFTFSRWNGRMEEAFGGLGTLDCGFAELKEPVLTQAVSLWSRRPELNR
ncbi:MAG: recombinase family protein [Candidatus Peribacteraceae bacterium]